MFTLKKKRKTLIDPSKKSFYCGKRRFEILDFDIKEDRIRYVEMPEQGGFAKGRTLTVTSKDFEKLLSEGHASYNPF